MRGPDIQQDALFSTVSPEPRVPKDHPLRPIRTMVDTALRKLDTDFNALYSEYGRDSIPPEKLLRAQLLMAFYTIRSERQLMEQIDYNLLFRWFVGFSMDDRVRDHSTFTKNRDRLLEGDIARRFFAQVLSQAKQADPVAVVVTPMWISMGRSAAGIPMSRRRTRMPCCSGRAKAQRQSWLIWDIC